MTYFDKEPSLEWICFNFATPWILNYLGPNSTHIREEKSREMSPKQILGCYINCIKTLFKLFCLPGTLDLVLFICTYLLNDNIACLASYCVTQYKNSFRHCFSFWNWKTFKCALLYAYRNFFKCIYFFKDQYKVHIFLKTYCATWWIWAFIFKKIFVLFHFVKIYKIRH